MYAVICIHSYHRRSPGWSAGRLEWRCHRRPHRRIRWRSISRFCSGLVWRGRTGRAGRLSCRSFRFCSGLVWRGRTGRAGRFNCRSNCRFLSGLAAGHLMNMYTKCLYEIIYIYVYVRAYINNVSMYEYKKKSVFILTGDCLEEIIACRKWIKKKRMRKNRTTEEDAILSTRFSQFYGCLSIG